ncbi:chemosensory protein 15 isoform X1 [Bombyx mori]
MGEHITIMIENFYSKCTISKSVLFLCLIFLPYALNQKYYDSRYDYYDIDHLVQNPRLLKKYLDCFLGKGPCTPIGRLFKQVMPEVITTACAKCTPTQKRFARKTFNAFRRYFPETLMELRRKFDPESKYYDAFEKVITNA